MAYYLEAKAAPHAFKPYDRRQVKRDVHECGIVSARLSKSVRQSRRGQR